MAAKTQALTDNAIRNAKPRDKAFKLFDGGGLFVLVTPTGQRWWRLKYRHEGKEKGLALGVYPKVTLKDARARTADARRLLDQGVDPAAERTRAKTADTFATLAERWLAENAGSRAAATVHKHRFFIAHMAPHLGHLAPDAITAADVVRMVRAVHGQGIHETARRCCELCARILRYGVAHGLVARNPAADVSLRDLLPPKVTRNRAAVTDPAAVGELLRAVDTYQGAPVTRLALRFLALTFVRPGELRGAEWGEFDGDTWRIPAHRMKMRAPHVVPLSRPALAILRELRPLTGAGRYVFASAAGGVLSENTLNGALRRLGYDKDTMTAHGFRALASSLLHEQGFPPMVIERQLAHAERNKVAGAYNRADLLPERRRMMQAWADYLDGLRAGGVVVPIKRRKRPLDAAPG